MNMKYLYTTLLCIIAIATDLSAQQYSARHDSLFVYNSWESIMDQWPDTVVINPEIAIWTPYDFEFEANDKETTRMLKKETVAVAIGDTTWLINTEWLRDNKFKGDCKKMDDYAPFFFNAKVAFIECVPTHTSLGMALLGSLLGDSNAFTADPWENPANFYWIDFENKRVDKIDHKKLSQLLDTYPDLRRRFEQMADYKERYMVNSYFIDFIKRVERDPGYPYLLDRLYPPQPLE